MRVVSALVTVNKKRAEGTSPSKRSHGIAAGNLSLYNLRVKNGCAVSNCENKCGVLVNRQKGSFLFRGFPRLRSE